MSAGTRTTGSRTSRGGYNGKHYPNGSTEIVSMGLLKLSEDPVGFARSDPEYFKLIIGILDGSLLHDRSH